MICPFKFNSKTLDRNGEIIQGESPKCECEMEECALYITYRDLYDDDDDKFPVGFPEACALAQIAYFLKYLCSKGI